MKQYILLVENHQPSQQVIQEILEMSGYKVLVADDGHRALSLFKQNQEQINLVITDLAMPELDGLALMAALRAIAPDLKIILVTIRVDLVNTPTHPIHQADRVLAKPFSSIPHFIEVIAELLSA